MAILRIRHETVYRYRSPVAFGEHRALLRPRESMDQRTLDYRLEVEPRPARVSWQEDASGNAVVVMNFDRRAPMLRVVATMVVEQTPFDTTHVSLPAAVRTCPFSYPREKMPDLARFIERQQPDAGGAVEAWARRILDETPGRDSWAFLCRMNDAIEGGFSYIRREEEGIQDAAATLRSGRGSCRDFAVLMAEAVRSLGFAARFVSGYLYVPHDESHIRQAGGNTHAWLQVFLPSVGWVDFDPTSGWVGNAGLVRVATVRDPRQAMPLSGSFTGFPGDFLGMSVDVDVTSEGYATPAAWVSMRAAAR
ncbi:transglutaminase family protein [Enterovirga rhinocerotis]|uniref:Transglutaminase-like putative cysteine protease n=1 Tax=Enterovirga rhinocerotis TaxID=1339210 RepID=A0A4R7C8S0_9HYPH|nr:transglutaminase family protein [Enterovirga rhinocerotis]TDR94663.1 transglutaminase-like putative cysteine protease [Enterovirga rhinocerotis]